MGASSNAEVMRRYVEAWERIDILTLHVLDPRR
jgi:hypothetical protein